MLTRARKGQAGLIAAIVVVMVTLMATALAINYMDNTVAISNKKAEAVSDTLTLKSIMDTGRVKTVYYYNETSGELAAWAVYDLPEPVKLDMAKALINLSTGSSSRVIAVVNNTDLILSGRGFTKILDYNLTKYTGAQPVNISVIGLKLGLSYKKASTGLLLNTTKTDEPLTSGNIGKWLSGGNNGSGGGTVNPPGGSGTSNNNGSNGENNNNGNGGKNFGNFPGNPGREIPGGNPNWESAEVKSESCISKRILIE
jgi:flagellin-like protein